MLDELVDSFCLAIGLGMCWGGVKDCCALIGQESPECVIVELGAIVSNDGLGYSKTTVQVSPKKVDYFFSGDCCEGLCLNPFCVVIHNDNGVFELSRGCGELSDEIELKGTDEMMTERGTGG